MAAGSMKGPASVHLAWQNFKAQLNRRIEAFLIPEKSEDDVVARLTPPSFRYCTCKLL